MGPEPVPSLDIEMPLIANELQRKMVEEIECVMCGNFPFSPLECRKCNKLFCKHCQNQLLGASGAHNEDDTADSEIRKISKEKLDEIVDRTKKGGAEIVKYLEKGSAFYAPAASGVEMAESYLQDQKKQLPCAVYLDGKYDVKDLYAGVPVIIGKNGVEKVIELNLSPEEKNNFDNSAKAVKELFEAAQKIDDQLI